MTLLAKARLAPLWLIGYGLSDSSRNGEYRFLRKQLQPGMSVIDIGANIGEHTDHMLQVEPSLSVRCFEPMDAPLAHLRKRFRSDDRVTIADYALGEFAGTATMYAKDSSLEGSTSASLYNRSLWSGRSDRYEVQKIRVSRLDDELGDGVVDFIKIDVEGHELSVLRGAISALTHKRIRCLQFEYGGTFKDAGASIVEIAELLDDHGYRLYRLLPFGKLRISLLLLRIRGDTYRYSNWVAMCD